MKKTKLFKSLLVAAGLCVGASAWAGETWDFTNSETWGSVALPTEDNNSVSYNSNGEAATTGNVVTFYSTEGNFVHASTATNGIAFKTTGGTSDNYIKLSVPAGSAASVTAYVSSNRNIKVQFGNRTDTYSASWAEVTKDYDNTSGTADVDLIIYCSANAGGAGQAPFLRKIVLQQAVAVTTTFVDENDNVIAPPVTEFIETGTSYTPSYVSPLYISSEDPYTYTYVSGASTRTITSATTFKIVYSKSSRPSYTVSIVKKFGDETESSEATIYEGASYTYYYPRFVLDGTTLYRYASSTDANASNNYWTSTLTNVSADATYTLTYNAIPGQCVYYAEGEDISNASSYTNGTFVARSSNGGIGVLTNNEIITLGEGTYQISARVIGRADRSVDFFMGSNSPDNLIFNAGSGTTGNESTSDAFTLTENTAIVANGGYVTTSENGHGFDYIYIMKLVDFTAEFYNDAEWEKVYAYTFNPETLGGWPGKELTVTDGVYKVSFCALAAPTNIIFNNGKEGDENVQTADLEFEDGASYNSQGKLNTYTATFTTNLDWDPIYAYAWNGDGDTATKFFGDWPGKEISVTNGKATLSFHANNAPEKIIFNNGKQPNEEGAAQTDNLIFEDGKTYTWNNYTVYFTTDWTNANAWAWNVNEDNSVTDLCGTWPGTAMSGSDGSFTYTYTGVKAPDMILFNNGSDQTNDFAFEDGATYNYNGVSSVSKSISAAGYATYCSPYALDFTNSGLTAYIAKKGTDNKITFSTVTKVPAGTGVLLKGAAGEYAINTTTAATDDVTGNVFEGVLTDTQVDPGIFVLMNGSAGVGFYVTTKTFTVGANTAYIPASVAGARTFIGFDFDNTTTAIEGVANVKADNGEIYNLQGQRVVKAQKGLYIINGKKVVLK